MWQGGTVAGVLTCFLLGRRHLESLGCAQTDIAGFSRAVQRALTPSPGSSKAEAGSAGNTRQVQGCTAILCLSETCPLQALQTVGGPPG